MKGRRYPKSVGRPDLSRSQPIEKAASSKSTGSSLPLPSDARPHAYTLPLPDGPRDRSTKAPGPTTSAPPLTNSSALEALYEEKEQGSKQPPRARQPQNSDAADAPGVKSSLVLGGLVVAALGALWMLQDKTEAPDVEAPRPSPVLERPDAGAAFPARTNLETNRQLRATPKPEPTKPVGYLTVFSTPTGATVLVDGGYVGKTPLVMKHEFENRDYKLELRLEGHKAWSKSMRPEPGKTSLSAKAILEKQ